MSSLSIQTIVVCAPATTVGAAIKSICPSVDSQLYGPTAMQAYVLAPGGDVDQIGAISSAPDAGTVAQVWAAAFSLVLVCYVIARAVGVVLQMIREA